MQKKKIYSQIPFLERYKHTKLELNFKIYLASEIMLLSSRSSIAKDVWNGDGDTGGVDQVVVAHKSAIQ